MFWSLLRLVLFGHNSPANSWQGVPKATVSLSIAFPSITYGHGFTSCMQQVVCRVYELKFYAIKMM